MSARLSSEVSAAICVECLKKALASGTAFTMVE
jgi:hypothetical protein